MINRSCIAGVRAWHYKTNPRGPQQLGRNCVWGLDRDFSSGCTSNRNTAVLGQVIHQTLLLFMPMLTSPIYTIFILKFVSVCNTMHLSMVCPILHTWDRCWGKEEDLPSPRGWYLVRIVPVHSNGIHILSHVTWKAKQQNAKLNDKAAISDASSNDKVIKVKGNKSIFLVTIFLKNSLWISQIPMSPCHTLCMTGR